MLLLERKRIIHKANNKLATFRKIVSEIMSSRGNLDFSFIYAPEGDENDINIYDSDEARNLLLQYMEVIEDDFAQVKVHHFTSETDNRTEVMKLFEQGHINSLFSMKCLDEGVDIPRAELAIFCSSTGNPRQFIQRRGRILRTHADKDRAAVHDLVVLPLAGNESSTFSLEQKLIREELIRVIYFASLAENYYDAMEKFQPIAESYDFNMYSLQEELGLEENEEG